jgi:hypothetical protein
VKRKAKRRSLCSRCIFKDDPPCPLIVKRGDNPRKCGKFVQKTAGHHIDTGAFDSI